MLSSIPLPLLMFGAVGAALAAVSAVVLAPTHWLIGLHFLLQFRQDTWSVGGVRVDTVDVALFVLVLSLAVRGAPRGTRGSAMPYRFAWLGLVVFLMVAYAVSPNGQRDMTDPLRSAYQLYR